MIDRAIMRQWAEATRRQQWDEANRLWGLLMEQWLVPPEVKQMYWNILLDRRMAVLERREQRSAIDDDQWDRDHEEMNR